MYSGITDNAKNIVNAAELVLGNTKFSLMEEKEDDLDNEQMDIIDQIEDEPPVSLSVRCSNHTLDLAVRSAISAVPIVGNDIHSICTVVISIKASTK